MVEIVHAERDPAAERQRRAGWLASVGAETERWHAAYDPALGSGDVPIRPERLCRELSDWLPSDAVVLVDTGHAGMWMGQFLDLTSPDQRYLRSCGHLGWAFPAGIGAKCAVPDRPVVTFTGDGGLYYHLAEIETMVRRRVNAITVVNDNFGGNQSQRGFDRSYGGKATEKAREMFTYEKVDLAAVATAMGALGIVVDKPDQLPSAFDRALSADRPVVLDVRTDFEVLAPPAVS
jgi:acetolactate synthase-1/2/3 large subunit